MGRAAPKQVTLCSGPRLRPRGAQRWSGPSVSAPVCPGRRAAELVAGRLRVCVFLVNPFTFRKVPAQRAVRWTDGEVDGDGAQNGRGNRERLPSFGRPFLVFFFFPKKFPLCERFLSFQGKCIC